LNKLELGKRGQSLFSFCAFHFLDDGFTDSIYLLLPFIAAELHLSFSQVGLLKGVFSASMSLFQVPLSLLGERVGELTVIACGTFGLAAGFLFLSMSYSFPKIFFSLIFAKGTAAGQHGLGSSVLSRVYEISGRRTAMGTYNFSGDVGKVVLPFLVALMINFWDWRLAILILSLGGVGAGTILWILAGKMGVLPPWPQSREKPALEGSRWGVRDPKSFYALLTIGVIDISARMALLTFLPFLLLQKGISATQIGFALTLLFVGGAVGKFACGVLAEWLGIIPMVVGTEILTAVGILSLHWSSASGIWFLLPLVGIVLNGTSSVLYATVAEIITPTGRSRGYGLYYAITLGCGAISPVIYGFVTDFLGLSFTILSTGLMVLLTIPLTRYLSNPESA
jgi:FSR family fosmidomycin resistance protein-like MFS transporter